MGRSGSAGSSPSGTSPATPGARGLLPGPFFPNPVAPRAREAASSLPFLIASCTSWASLEQFFMASPLTPSTCGSVFLSPLWIWQDESGRANWDAIFCLSLNIAPHLGPSLVPGLSGSLRWYIVGRLWLPNWVWGSVWAGIADLRGRWEVSSTSPLPWSSVALMSATTPFSVSMASCGGLVVAREGSRDVGVLGTTFRNSLASGTRLWCS